jgi:hypothetical protein
MAIENSEIPEPLDANVALLEAMRPALDAR